MSDTLLDIAKNSVESLQVDGTLGYAATFAELIHRYEEALAALEPFAEYVRRGDEYAAKAGGRGRDDDDQIGFRFVGDKITPNVGDCRKALAVLRRSQR